MKNNHTLSTLIALMIGLSFHLSAQTSIGLKIGVNRASRSSSAVVPYPREISHRIGLIVGGIVQQDFGSVFSVLAEPMYIGKGSKLTIPGIGGFQIVKFMPSYLELPLSFKARFPVGTLQPFVLAGPFVSILLSAQGESEIDGRVFTRDDKGDTRPMEFGFHAGLGAQYSVSQSVSLLADARYSKGLSNVFEESFGQTDKSYGFQFTVGVMHSL